MRRRLRVPGGGEASLGLRTESTGTLTGNTYPSGERTGPRARPGEADPAALRVSTRPAGRGGADGARAGRGAVCEVGGVKTCFTRYRYEGPIAKVQHSSAPREDVRAIAEHANRDECLEYSLSQVPIKTSHVLFY